MTERERQMIEKITALPEELRELFLAMLLGANIAMDAMKAAGAGRHEAK